MCGVGVRRAVAVRAVDRGLYQRRKMEPVDLTRWTILETAVDRFVSLTLPLFRRQ